MLSNAYFLAKYRFDTAENEPTKKFVLIQPRTGQTPSALSCFEMMPGVVPREAKKLFGLRMNNSCDFGNFKGWCARFGTISANFDIVLYAFCIF